jgi:hypothetical protein
MTLPVTSENETRRFGCIRENRRSKRLVKNQSRQTAVEGYRSNLWARGNIQESQLTALLLRHTSHQLRVKRAVAIRLKLLHSDMAARQAVPIRTPVAGSLSRMKMWKIECRDGRTAMLRSGVRNVRMKL